MVEAVKKEFIVRSQKNESYSMRAYARSLQVDHSLLAKILRGDKSISKKMALQIGEKIGLSTSRIQEMMSETAEFHPSQQINEDVFIVMSDWYHFAILELMKTNKFKPSIKSIANSLSISPAETELAIERLMRLGFVQADEKGKLILAKPNNNWFDHEQTNSARKIMQKQFLKKAIEAVDEVEFAKRANSSLTLAISPKDLPKLKKHIQSFLDEVDEMEEKSINRKEEVYQICVALFPLTTQETL